MVKGERGMIEGKERGRRGERKNAQRKRRMRRGRMEEGVR